MKIGIDARNLIHSLSGIGRYVWETSKALSAHGHSLVLYLPEAPHQQLPELPSCEFRIWDFKGPWRRVVWSSFVLPRAIKQDGLDVFWGPAHRLPPGLDAHLRKVLTIHDMVWRKAPETMHWQTLTGERFLMKPALKRADVIIADSRATADDIIGFMPTLKERIRIVYPGLTRFSEDEEVQLPPFMNLRSARYALFVGTLEPRKNLPRILNAFASVPVSVRKDLKLVIAGGQGWRMANLTDLVKKVGLENEVVITGRVSDSQLAELYLSAQFLLMPSMYEGFGFPIIEAQSFGVPVITSNISSMPEAAGAGAILVDPRSEEQIARAIASLITDRELAKRLSSLAKENHLNFSWDKTATEIASIMAE